MNANQIINMVIRMVMNKVMRSGMNAGVNAVSKRMNKGKPTDAADQNPQATRDTAKRMNQTMKMARRVGRM